LAGESPPSLYPTATALFGVAMIDIDKLNEAELIDLNHRVVARLQGK
jgi:hypothetical protein